MSKSSFFKLPALFAAVYFLLSVIVSDVLVYFRFKDMIQQDSYDLERFISQITSNSLFTLFWSMFYFFIASLACYRYKLHRININNIVVILVSAVILSILVWSESFLWSYFVIGRFIQRLMALGDYSMTIISLLVGIISFVHTFVRIFLIAGVIFLLFKLLSVFGKDNGHSFEFNSTNNRSIYATLYTLLFYSPAFIFSSYFLYSLLSVLMLNMSISPFIVFFAVVASMLIHLCFVYYSTRNCFIHVYPTLQVARLFKSWGISIGIFSVFYLIVSAIFYLGINKYFIRSLYYGYELENIVIFFMLVLFVFNYLAFYFINRFAIRCCFSR